MNPNETNSDCEHYNWGNGYPRAYGAKCDKFNRFFSKDKAGVVSPNCFECDCGNKKEME